VVVLIHINEMRGGRRTGAGRKKGFAAKNAEEARRILSEMVASEVVPIAQALIARAKEGHIPATRELFDRAWGKAPQALHASVELESDAGQYSTEELKATASLVGELLKSVKIGGANAI
jgi:hypothetical protein